jgi:hypothetical protein
MAANLPAFNNIHLPINYLQFGTTEVGSIPDSLPAEESLLAPKYKAISF